MGSPVRRRAASPNINADAKTTLSRASARGPAWRDPAEARLGTILGLAASVEEQLEAAREAASPLISALGAAHGQSDDVVAKVSDDVWNAVGRPANDPWLSVIFPGGYSHYTDGELEAQPARMEILARLLESNLHPKLSPQKSEAATVEVRASAAQLRQAIEASREPVALVGVLERVRTAVARNTAMELANLKRAYKIAGFTEAEIHTVIPDRSRKPAPAKPSPPKPAPQESAAPAPQERAKSAPQESVAPAPQERANLAPQESGAPAPESLSA